MATLTRRTRSTDAGCPRLGPSPTSLAPQRTCRELNGPVPSIPCRFPFSPGRTIPIPSPAQQPHMPLTLPPRPAVRPLLKSCPLRCSRAVHPAASVDRTGAQHQQTKPPPINTAPSLPSFHSNGVGGEGNGGGGRNGAAPLDGRHGPAQLRRRAPQEHPLLRGPALRPPPARPARPLAPRLRPQRRRHSRGKNLRTSCLSFSTLQRICQALLLES